MRTLLTFVLLAASGPALAQAESPRLQQAKKECWAEVGVMGDPYKSRGSSVHIDTVTKCVRAKMGTGSGRR